jgi:hypothetical protein
LLVQNRINRSVKPSIRINRTRTNRTFKKSRIGPHYCNRGLKWVVFFGPNPPYPTRYPRLVIRNKLIKLKGKHNTVAIIYVDKTTAPLLYRLLQKLHPSSKDPTITYYSYCIDVPWLNTVFTVSSYFSSKPDLLLLLFNSTLLVPEFASPEPNHPKLLSLVFREKTPVCVNKMGAKLVFGLSDIIKVERKTRKMINEFWSKVDPNLFIDFRVFLSSFFYYLKLNTL